MANSVKKKEHGILFMNIVTPLHNGSGEGLGIVDNPIMRERTTQFPIVQASSIKGVLRDAYGDDNDKDVITLFGPPPGRGDEHAGAVSFGEGEILAFPVRSLKGCFVWVTSPLVLYRFYQKVAIIGMENSFPKLKELVNTENFQSGLSKSLICESGKDSILVKIDGNNERLLIEEFPIECEASTKLEKFANEIGEMIYENDIDDFLKDEFNKKLVVLDEDMFRYFVTNATEVVSNIKIGDKGTTEIGSLRYTEYLPSETIMYSILTFDNARKYNMNKANEEELKEMFTEGLPRNIQVGGDETTGKGIVKLEFFDMEGSNDGQKSGS